jgi:hypothetical protein
MVEYPSHALGEFAMNVVAKARKIGGKCAETQKLF